MGFRKRSIILCAVLALVGCIDHDSRPLTVAQKNLISERIKPFSIVNVEGQGILQVAMAEELPGQAKYAGCVACHGAQGQGGLGPALAGKSHEYLVGRLLAYKAGETVGAQSSMMWTQASMLSEKAIHEIVEYIETL